jgi:5-methylcytosine-specific restriction endonuclease McrBC regulatory subunit McrC
VKEQARGQYLVDEHANKPFYELRPDLLLSKQGRGSIVDTKWKIISSAQDIKKGSDLYQLFAYAEKCLAGLSAEAKGPSFLIYPTTENFPHAIEPFYFRKNSPPLYAVSYDLENDLCPIMVYLLSGEETT